MMRLTVFSPFSLLHLLLTTKSYSRERLALILWQMQLCAKEIKRITYNKFEVRV
jgi:hypothetical protein